MSEIIKTFEARLSAALGQVPAGSVYLAAVSGGADSTAMLAGLAALREEKRFALNCVHVEHGIRPASESQGDALSVQALCEKFEVPCRVYSIPQGKVAAFAAKGGPGIEGAARYFRHRELRREARRLEAFKILIAHTRDDNLENLLMRILRGSGPRGLALMPQNRGLLFRPLLDMTRKDILEYLEEKGLSYKTDSTNLDIHYLRNRVRHKLIPLLEEFFPSWRTSLFSLGETQSLTADFLVSEAIKRLPWQAGTGDTLRIPEELFLDSPPILREEAIFLGANMLMADKPPSAPQRRAVVRNASRQLQSQDLGQVHFDNKNGYINLSIARRSRNEKGFSLLINKAGLYTLEGKVLGLGKNRDLRIKADAPAQFPLVLRNHQQGDRIIRGRHRRRFSDILGKVANFLKVITACDADGPAAFIGITNDWKIIVISREESKKGAFEVSFIED